MVIDSTLSILRSKKGFFFTILAIMLVSVFIVVFTSTSTLREQRRFSSAQSEALLLNSFTEQLEEEYLATAMKIAGINAINAMTAYINQTTPVPLDNPEEDFSNAANAGMFKTPVEINPSSNPLGTSDLVFTLTFTNQTATASDEITSVGPVIDKAYFGSTLGLRQEFHSTTTNRLASLIVDLTNESAISNYLIALVYDDTQEPIAFAEAYFQDGLPTEFIFNELIFLDTTRSHYFYLFAPYNPPEAYGIDTADQSSLECHSPFVCNADTVEYNAPSPETMLLPLDLQLNEPIIRGGSFQSLMRNLELLALTDLNLMLEVNVSDFEVDQDESPWTIDVSGNFNITTKHTTVSFSKDKQLEVNISILDAYDPLSFFLSDETGGALPVRRINASNITLWDDPNAFTTQYGSDTYIHHPATTKYLDRFSNDHTGSDCCGIAYLVPQELADFNKMYLDDSYLGGLSCDVDTPHYWISGYNNNFKFTLELIEFFSLDDEALLHDCSLPSE